MRAGEADRVEAAMRKVKLGWLYNAMRDKFYFDEIYQATFVNGFIWLAKVFDAFDYGQDGKHGVVDGLVNLAGRVGRGLSQVSNWIDTHIVDGLVNLAGRAGILGSEAANAVDLQVVDGAVDGIGDVVRAGGRAIRPIQTGRVQNYLLLASLMVLALIAAFFMILFLQI